MSEAWSTVSLVALAVVGYFLPGKITTPQNMVCSIGTSNRMTLSPGFALTMTTVSAAANCSICHTKEKIHTSVSL